MAEESKGGSGKLLLVLLGLGAAFFLTRKGQAASAAAGNDPLAPPPDKDPSRTPTDLAAAWATWAHNVLAHYGYSTVPSYETATSATEQIVDASGAGRNLVLRNQAVTDAFLAFMWDINAIFKFKTLNPDTDPAAFEAVRAKYQKLVAGFTPQFLT